MMGRWIKFFLMMAIGAGMGLVYAWKISPVQYVGASLPLLRVDYRTDYVLMTAEAYSHEGDLQAAVDRLAQLDSASPEEVVLQAILFAEQHGYTDEDLTRMRMLAADLGGYQATGTATP